MSSSHYADCFDVPEHADVLLRVYTGTDTDSPEPAAKRARTESEGGSNHDSAPPSRSYHCHVIILSVQSGYLKAQLSSAWQQPSGSSSTPPEAGPRKTVDIHVEAEELDALHELLKMMYSQTLPAAGAAAAAADTTSLLLQCLRLADRFAVVHCLELLVGGLAATPSDAIDSTMLDYVFRASPGVCVSRSYPALLESCSKALVRLFGDVPTVIEDEALLQQFCSLPHAAVLAWVKSDDLQVHSENCVVFLLSAWAHANQNSTAAQLEELAQHIRVFHLGPAYLHGILPNLSWFKDCSNMEYLPAVLSCISAGINMKMGQGFEAEKGKMFSGSSFIFPLGWCAKPRSSSSSPSTCSWVFSPSQLREVDEGKVLVLSSPVSINGLLMRLHVQQVSTDPSAPAPDKSLGVSFGLYLGVDAAAMAQRGLPLPDRLLVQLGSPRVKVGGPGSEQRKDAFPLKTALNEAAELWGSRSFLGAAAPTFLELVGPFLDAGRLHIEAAFSAVDA